MPARLLVRSATAVLAMGLACLARSTHALNIVFQDVGLNTMSAQLRRVL